MRIVRRPEAASPSAPHVSIPAEQARALSRKAELDRQQRSFRTASMPQPPSNRRPPG